MATRVGKSVLTVRRWRRRYAAKGVDGLLNDATRPARAQAADGEENQAGREPDAQREAAGRHPLERTHDGGESQYRIKSMREPHERVVKESDLELGSGGALSFDRDRR